MKRPVVWLLLGCLLQVASVAGQPTLRGLNSTSPESRRKLLDISGKKEMVRDDTEMVQVPFDCDTGFANWKFGWSNAKKLYCCKKVGRACVHDCKAGKTSQWSNEKKGYCCKTQHLGCEAQEPFDCEAGFADWKYGWGNAKKEYCCQHHDKGCMEKVIAPTEAPLFDCDAGFADWKFGWSTTKKDYCCKKEGRGCLHDCNAGLSHWSTKWSTEKKGYCCKTKKLGCESHVIKDLELFDCDAGFADWKYGWSTAKKAILLQPPRQRLHCRHHGSACSGVEAAADRYI